MSESIELLSQPEIVEPWGAFEWLIALLFVAGLIGGVVYAVQTWA